MYIYENDAVYQRIYECEPQFIVRECFFSGQKYGDMT